MPPQPRLGNLFKRLRSIAVLTFSDSPNGTACFVPCFADAVQLSRSNSHPHLLTIRITRNGGEGFRSSRANANVETPKFWIRNCVRFVPDDERCNRSVGERLAACHVGFP